VSVPGKPIGVGEEPASAGTAVGAGWDALVVTSQQPCEPVADELDRLSRVVDRDQRSWMLTRDPDGNDVYTADMHRCYLTVIAGNPVAR
jgi:hypothetical protein